MRGLRDRPADVRAGVFCDDCFLPVAVSCAMSAAVLRPRLSIQYSVLPSEV